MKRSIKFRGQREDTMEYVYGSLIEDKYIVGNVIDWNEDYFNTEYWWRVIPETIGQFTEMMDKNNKEIYEYDFVRDIRGNVGYVIFSKQEMGYVIVYKDHDTRLGLRNTGSHYDIDINIAVIGNIHDNKELL